MYVYSKEYVYFALK